MWNKPVKKTIFTLCIENYAPKITEITFPLINRYAKKIGANFHVIKERKWPSFPPVYEKLQIYQLAQEMENDWNLFVDADTLINPTMPDITNFVDKDTVLHNGSDFASIRWRYDRYFLRNKRNIGSCNWFALASDWCIDLWHPLDDLTFEEAIQNIFPVISEYNSGVIEPEHLIDDYTLSRNIAKYGLNFKTFIEIQDGRWGQMGGFLWHKYACPNEQKIIEMKQVLKSWRIT
jgi:hypothetical protein